MIPVIARTREARVTLTGESVMLGLDNQFGRLEVIVDSRHDRRRNVCRSECRYLPDADLVRQRAPRHFFGGRIGARARASIGSHASVDQDVLVIQRLDEIAAFRGSCRRQVTVRACRVVSGFLPIDMSMHVRR